MDEFRERLEAEARRVSAEPDALDRIRERAHRRRITRHVGAGATALAIAGAGFALAFGAFRTGPPVTPQAGPSSASPSSIRPLQIDVLGVACEGVAAEAKALGQRLEAAGYDPQVAIEHGVPAPPTTVIRYLERVKQEALRIRDEFAPGAPAIRGHIFWDYSFAADEGPIQVVLGTDYQQLANGAVRVRVLNAGGGTAATEAAADMLQEAGYHVVEVGGSDLRIKAGTIVACAPAHDEEGFRILKRFFPDAHFTGEVPSEDHDVTVYIGPD